MTPHVNGYSGIGYGYYFSYPFCKYPWISNSTRTRTRGYRLIPESMPNGFLPVGTRIMDIHCHLYYLHKGEEESYHEVTCERKESDHER
jgi:hypothetical protein